MPKGRRAKRGRFGKIRCPLAGPAALAADSTSKKRSSQAVSDSPRSSAPLRIAFYGNLMGWPKRSSGGVRQWTLTMANALVDRGHMVDVLSEAPKDKFVDEPLLDARVGRVVLGKGRAAMRELRAYADAHPGVRIVSALDHWNLRAAQLKRACGANIYVMLTQRENLSADAAWRARIKYWLITRGVRKWFSQADAVVTVSRGLELDLRDNFGVDPQRLHTIYNPAFRANFVESARTPVDHPWLNDKTAPVLVAAGRLHFVKGFDDLLKAFAQLRQRRHARLIILGEGKERAALERQIAELDLGDSVQLPGRMGSIAPWIARSDLFVLSSRREGLPAVLIEALALGARIVSTRCPSGPEEILDDGKWGTLVDVGDVAALTRAMDDALSAPEPDRAAMQARAAQFSLESALKNYLALWNRAPLPAR